MSNNKAKENKKTPVEKIFENYKNMNRMMVEEMKFASDHSTITGSNREFSWGTFLERIIPKKFSFESNVMIIDSYGEISKEIDICIFDQQYTPYIFTYNNIKFIPIEAVAIVVESKSISLSTENLKAWSDSIKNLKPSTTGISRIMTGHAIGFTNKNQQRTLPIRILGSLYEHGERSEIENELKNHFDFMIFKENDLFEFFCPYEENTLGWWSKRLNNYNDEIFHEGKDESLEIYKLNEKDISEADYEYLKFDDSLNLMNTLSDLRVDENPILSFNFQLNQLLMLINNPMLFPHFAYSKCFNDIK